MGQEPCGVGIVGMDHWYIAFLVLKELKERTDFPLVGVADHHEWRLEAIRGQCNAPRTTEYDRVIEDPSIGLIVSMVNTAENPSICKKALACGKHVLSVKPLAMNLADLESVISVAEENSRWFGSFESYRRLSGAGKKVRELVQSCAVGDLVTYHQMTHAGLPQAWEGEQESGWWLDPEKVCGGGWIDHGIYGVDTARWLFDQPVKAVSGTMTRRRFQDLPFEDYGVAVLEFPCGGTAVLEDSWTADHHSSRELIVGTKGFMVIDSALFGDDIGLATESGKEVIHVDGEESVLVELCRGLFDGAPLPFGLEDSMANLATCFAVYQSDQRGETIILQ